MNGSNLQISADEVSRLSATDQRDLQQFIENEQQKAQVQRTIHELSETCFKKCIKGSSIAGGGSGRLSSKEDSCFRNCVDRFMDSNLAVLKHLELLRASQ